MPTQTRERAATQATARPPLEETERVFLDAWEHGKTIDPAPLRTLLEEATARLGEIGHEITTATRRGEFDKADVLKKEKRVADREVVLLEVEVLRAEITPDLVRWKARLQRRADSRKNYAKAKEKFEAAQREWAAAQSEYNAAGISQVADTQRSRVRYAAGGLVGKLRDVGIDPAPQLGGLVDRLTDELWEAGR